MCKRFSGSMTMVAIAAVAGSVVISAPTTTASAQAPTAFGAMPAPFPSLKTAWGEPDLQGTLVILDTQRIVVEPGVGEPLENVQWSDTIPKLLQEKIIQSFEASNYVSAVAKPMEGIAADYQVLIDLRSFQITGAPAMPVAHVEFAAKVLGEAGRIVGSRGFDVVVPATDVSAAGAAAALNQAFGKAATDLVTGAARVL